MFKNYCIILHSAISFFKISTGDGEFYFWLTEEKLEKCLSDQSSIYIMNRVAEVGSLSARATMAMQIFVWRVFAIFVVRRLQIANLIQYNMQYLPCYSEVLAQETLPLTQKTLLPKSSKKCLNCGRSYYLISGQNSLNVRAWNFCPSPNFSAKALRTFAQLLPPCL